MFQGCDFPTTGFFGVCVALQVCDQVTLFGFHDRGRTVRQNHYWKAGQDIAGGHHNFNLEHSLYRPVCSPVAVVAVAKLHLARTKRAYDFVAVRFIHCDVMIGRRQGRPDPKYGMHD